MLKRELEPWMRRGAGGERGVAGECENSGEGSLLLSFLESVPEVSAKLKTPNTMDEKFSDVVQSAQSAAVLVLVY